MRGTQSRDVTRDEMSPGSGCPCKYSGFYTREIGGHWIVLHKDICVVSRSEAGIWGDTVRERLRWDLTHVKYMPTRFILKHSGNPC